MKNQQSCLVVQETQMLFGCHMGTLVLQLHQVSTKLDQTKKVFICDRLTEVSYVKVPLPKYQVNSALVQYVQYIIVCTRGDQDWKN